MKHSIRKHIPTILTIFGSAGVIGTAILTAQATPKALRLIEDAEKESEIELTVVDKVKIAAPIYLPAILVGFGTITCIFGSNLMSTKNQRSLASAYMMVDQAYKEYRNKVIELHGKDTDDEIMDAIRIDHAKNTYITASSGFGFETCDLAVESDSKPVMFYEPYSQRYFMKKIEDVLNAEYHLNRNFVLGADANLNMFYSFLGLDETEAGDDLYWIPCDYYTWVDFDHIKRCLPDGREYYEIHMPYEPLPYELLEDHYL